MQFSSIIFLGLLMLPIEEQSDLIKTSQHQPENSNTKFEKILSVSKSGVTYLASEDKKITLIEETGRISFSVDGQILSIRTDKTGSRIAALAKKLTSGKEPGLDLYLLSKDSDVPLVLSLPHFFDDHLPEIAVSSHGDILVGSTTSNVVTLYNADGTAVKEITLFAKSPYSLERSMRLAFAPDGESFYIASMRLPAQPGNPFANENITLHKYNLQGKIIWQAVLPEQGLGAMRLAENGTLLAINTYDAFSPQGIVQSTHIFSTGGNLVSKLNTGFHDAEFTENNQRLLLFTKKQASLYDISDGAVVSSVKIESPQMIHAAACLSQGEGFMLLTGESHFLSGQFQFLENRLREYAANGDLLAQIEVDAALTPAAKIKCGTNNQIVLFDTHRIELYRERGQK
ncbi:MAG: hypothetical protein DWQ10_18485 [Calditrichaeota bacterium]|nr:MAG: hypothetical protein DWQ10_18485 [Calditrichota bacterium]